MDEDSRQVNQYDLVGPFLKLIRCACICAFPHHLLQASMIVADKDKMYQLTGDGNIMEPNGGVCAIGSGGLFALAAARALYDFPDLSAEDICKRSIKIAADLCVYTNHDVTLKKIEEEKAAEEVAA